MQRPSEIKLRIKSVADTRKITGAMETISVAKAKKAVQAANANAAFLEEIRILSQTAFCAEEFSNSVFGRSKCPGTVRVVLSSNKGLAGGFGQIAAKRASEDFDKDAGDIVFCAGYEAEEIFYGKGIAINRNFSEETDKPNRLSAEKIAGAVRTAVFSGVAGGAVVYYVELSKNGTARVNASRLLPVIADSAARVPQCDPSPDELLEKLLPAYLSWTLYGQMLLSAAAEHTARRRAMNSAGRNAEELLDELTLRYHGARQAAITTELTEIVSTGLGVRKN